MESTLNLMPTKLPNNKALKLIIETKAFKTSLAFLKSRRPALAPHRSLEDLFWEMDEKSPAALKGVEPHLQKVCWVFRKTLYSYSIFIGGSVLDQILYDKIRDEAVDDPVTAALVLIRSVGIHKPGVILYPIHSLGLLGVGLWEKLTKGRYELFISDAEICVRAQTNSLKETIAFVERSAESFGVNRTVPVESMEHYERSRPTKWLTRNPLLAVKAHLFSREYYENHNFIILQLERACSLLFCLASLQNGFPVLRNESLFSSGRTNNWETQDIHHFVLLEATAGNRKRFETRCIPMNARAIELAELSNVNVDINLKSWARRQPLMEKVCVALGTIEQGYLKSNILSDKEGVKHRTFKKIMQSLRYFRRSFRYTSGDDDVVMLTIALECLLTDSYAPNGGERLKERASILLKGHRRKSDCVREIGNIYLARNQIVHTAECEQEVDLQTVREGYTLCLLSLVERLPLLPKESGNPIQFIIEGSAPLALPTGS